MDKQIYMSTTVQGAIISFLSLLVMLLKLDIGNEEITQIVTTLFGLAGLIMTVYGRIKATGALKLGSKVLR